MISFVVASVAAAGLSGAWQAGRPAPAPAGARVELFLAGLQHAIEGHDRRAVAAMVQYPITVLVGGFQVPILDPATMLKTYDAVFTPDLENLIAQSGVPHAGRPAPAYPVKPVPDGMTLGGFLWIQRVGSGFKIARITVPPASSVRALRHQPARVSFPNGATAQLSGLLARRDEVQSYLVRAEKGQSLRVSITGFRGQDAVLRVMDERSRPVDGPARAGDRMWVGQVPGAGDYRIDVVRTAPDAAPELLYVLSVTLR